MTKEAETLYIGVRESIFNDYERQEQFDNAVKFLDQFFSQNVVIPRGENRHTYADVLHEWLEDTTQYLESKQSSSDKGFYKVYLFDGAEYRIQPSEPVMEWLWMDLRTPDTYGCPTDKYMTVDEASLYFRQSSTCFRVHQTKRVRT